MMSRKALWYWASYLSLYSAGYVAGMWQGHWIGWMSVPLLAVSIWAGDRADQIGKDNK